MAQLMGWVPFEERPRPDAHLARVKLSLDQMQRIEITSDDEEAVGIIFAWLLGQALLARQSQQDDDSAAPNMTIGQRILLARTRRRISQQRLANQLGVTRAAISLWEKDQTRPRPESIEAMAVIFVCDPEWITHGHQVRSAV